MPYRQRGLPPIFRLTSLATPGNIDSTLAQRGYQLVDPSWIMALPDLSAFIGETAIQTMDIDSWGSALLRIAGEVGLIDQKIAHLVGSAYRLLRSRQHRLRLDGAEKTRIKLDNESELSDARSAVTSLWLEIFQASSDAERSS